jgi:hypothetical protein
MANISVCESPTCAITVDGAAGACPKCGGPMRQITESKARAWVLIILGLFLVLMMGAITLAMLPMLLDPGAETDGGSSFSGTPQQAQMVLMLFGVVIAFGIAATANGFTMLKTGQQSRIFIVINIILGVLLVIAVWGFMGSVKPEG